jgi:hypothetical protein
MSSWTKKITTKRVLLFLLLLIKLAIFPHVGILFIVAAAHASEVQHLPSSDYRLVIVTSPSRLNQTPGRDAGDKDFYWRVVCGTQEGLDWAQNTIFKNLMWQPVTADNAADRDAYTHPHGPCDSKIVSSSRQHKKTVPLAAIHGKSSDRTCKRISGCALNLDADNEEEYCPTCVWRENRLN